MCSMVMGQFKNYEVDKRTLNVAMSWNSSQSIRDWIIATVASKGKDRSLELLTVLSNLCLKCTTLNTENFSLKLFEFVKIYRF